MTRQARVRYVPETELERVRRFMPSNYTANWEGDAIIIRGEDSAGWTLDGYVIPRLASGLLYAEEFEEGV